MAVSASYQFELPPAARLIHRLPVLGIELYVVDADAAHRSQWLAVDAAGRVRSTTSAELLLLARMQLETLDALRRAGRPVAVTVTQSA